MLPFIHKNFLSFFRQLNLPQIQKILQDFEKQSEIMDMKEEIMNDAIDDAMEDEGDEEERWVLQLSILNFVRKFW